MSDILMVLTEKPLLDKAVQIYGTNEAPLFLARDIADWIEHSDVHKMVDAVDEDEKLIGTIFRAGQNREMWFFTEDG